MKIRLVLCVSILFAIVLSGCANAPMAFQKDTDRLTAKSKPVFLMTVTLKNLYRTSSQPRLLAANVEKADAKGAGSSISFAMDDIGRNETDDAKTGNSYLLRMELDAGRYEVRGLTSFSRSFPIIGNFFTPLHSPLESKETGVFYLGHVSATVRERQGNEFKAGASIPLIDQATVGASGGTFDVVITDEFATDEAAFRSKFPALAGITISKAVLPAFDRAKAQKWWESH